MLYAPQFWWNMYIPNEQLRSHILHFDNRLLTQMTSELIRIKGIFIKITQQDYHKVINGKVKGNSERNVDKVYI